MSCANDNNLNARPRSCLLPLLTLGTPNVLAEERPQKAGHPRQHLGKLNNNALKNVMMYLHAGMAFCLMLASRLTMLSSSAGVTSQQSPCRIQLVGLFPSRDGAFVEQHLGPFTLPPDDEQRPLNLHGFSEQLQQLLSIQNRSELKLFRFEYLW